MSGKKSLLEFQLEYLEFKFRYGEFEEKIRRKSAQKHLIDTEKAGLSIRKSRLAVTKIIYFPTESK